ncbi:DUF5994 family protein [Streptomyces mirabilis]|jgi:hypothetical protein|uniref:Uncharacterized protein n=1 Tax=Streptomyces mirabilis TaxID=68239 RepID=A0A1I2KWD8_9ACTN|nr:DUF5994 family protein [Streptomyces mirabilis]SFF71235.1 hypothetical protein SAMN02787118_11121 [Streptomyces mirabilis]
MEPTADHFTTSSKRPSLPPPVRLSLAPYEAVPGGFDGAWWPYSRNLVDELPVLVEAMDGVGSITRVILGIELWPDIPHQIAVGGHFVTAGWFATSHEQNEIVLCSYLKGFRTLLVVPPATATDTAAWLMNTPVPVDGSCTATELLANATCRLEAGLVDDPQ